MSKRKCLDDPDENTKKKKPRTSDDVDNQKTIDDALFIEITTKGRQILPTNPHKYSGCVYEKGPSWVVKFNVKNFYCNKTLKTKDEAETYKLKLNLDNDLVKNMIYEYKNEYYCALSNMNKLMRFSFQDFDVVEKYTWFGLRTRNTYATTHSDKGISTNSRFHQLLSKTESYEHKNSDTLDNRRENLQPKDNSEKNERIIVIKKQKEPKVDQLFIDVTTNGTKRYPMNWKKYTGSLTPYKNRWLTLIPYKGYPDKRRYHTTKKDASTYLKEVNIRQNLKIDNIIYEYKNEYYCVLSNKQKLMMFSKEDLELVENHTWCVCRIYAQTNIVNDKGYNTSRYFHQFLPLDLDINETCDHMYRNGLDNRRESLRAASKTTQSINQGMKSHNTSGTTGVSFKKKRSNWRAKWTDVNGKECGESFSISVYGDLAETKAIEKRKHMEETLPHYKKALMK